MNKLPSTFQPGDKVGLQTLVNLLEEAKDATVNAVNFSNSKVKYNIEVPVFDDGKEIGYFRLANIDAAFLHPPIENEFHYNSKVAIEARRQRQESEVSTRLLKDYFPKFLCSRIYERFQIDTVEGLQELSDKDILSVTMFGKMALQKLRRL